MSSWLHWCCCCCCPTSRKGEAASEYTPAEGNDNMTEQTPLLKSGASPASASRISNHMGPPPDRAFIIAQHEQHGILLLKAFKKRKGVHYQLPGGHIDSTDKSPAAAAARELFEETSIDIRSHLDRLSPLVLPNGGITLKGRVYFKLELRDEDSCEDSCESGDKIESVSDVVVDGEGEEGAENIENTDTVAGVGAGDGTGTGVSNADETERGEGGGGGEEEEQQQQQQQQEERIHLKRSLSETGEEFFLKLSHEHTGFRFVRSVNQAAELTIQHSGGCSSHALLALLPQVKK